MVRHTYEKDPKRDPNLENYPKENMSKPLEAPTASGLDWMLTLEPKQGRPRSCAEPVVPGRSDRGVETILEKGAAVWDHGIFIRGSPWFESGSTGFFGASIRLVVRGFESALLVLEQGRIRTCKPKLQSHKQNVKTLAQLPLKGTCQTLSKR